MFRIFTTEEFDRDFNKLDGFDKNRINKELGQIEINPYVGKPLGYKFFREKKVGGYWFYYLIYEEHVVVFVISISTKKNQQSAINKIKNLIPYYREEIKKKLNSS